MARKLFGKNIEPACEYCELGQTAQDNRMVLCKYKGVVPLHFSCRKFIYTPLKRIPKRPIILQKFSSEDFEA